MSYPPNENPHIKYSTYIRMDRLRHSHILGNDVVLRTSEQTKTMGTWTNSTQGGARKISFSSTKLKRRLNEPGMLEKDNGWLFQKSLWGNGVAHRTHHRVY